MICGCSAAKSCAIAPPWSCPTTCSREDQDAQVGASPSLLVQATPSQHGFCLKYPQGRANLGRYSESGSASPRPPCAKSATKKDSRAETAAAAQHPHRYTRCAQTGRLPSACQRRRRRASSSPLAPAAPGCSADLLFGGWRPAVVELPRRPVSSANRPAQSKQPGHTGINQAIHDVVTLPPSRNDASIDQPTKLIRDGLRAHSNGLGNVADAKLVRRVSAWRMRSRLSLASTLNSDTTSEAWSEPRSGRSWIAGFPVREATGSLHVDAAMATLLHDTV